MNLFRSSLARRFILFACCATALAPGLASAGPPRYRVIDLGVIGGNLSNGFAINSSGQVAGICLTQGGFNHAARWTGTPGIDLGTLGGSTSYGLGINDSGQVTGSAYGTDADGIQSEHATRWTGTTAEDLGALSSPAGFTSAGNAINVSGQVAGYFNRFNSLGRVENHTVRWTGTTGVDLGADLEFSYGWAINASGQIAGERSASDGNGGFHNDAIRWTGTTAEVLDSVGSTSVGLGINASGQVAGYTFTSSGGAAARWTGTAREDLGTLGGTFSQGFAINTAGEVAGMSLTAEGTNHLFLYTGGQMYDLSALIVPGSGATELEIVRGASLNDAGQVALSGMINGQSHALRLDPRSPAEEVLVKPAFQVESQSVPSAIVPGAPLHFSATETAYPAGIELHVQFATSASGAFTNLADGNGGRLQDGPGTGEYVLDSTSYPAGQTIFFRVVAIATGVTDQPSDPIGPFNLSVPVPALTIYEEALDADANPATTAGAGGTITYKITVVNTGSVLAKKLSVKTIIPDANFGTVADPNTYVVAQFGSSSVTPGPGGKVYTTDQTDSQGHALTGIKWDAFGDLKPGAQRFVFYKVAISPLVKIPSTIGNENRYAVSSLGAPAQPAGVFDRTSNNRTPLHTDLRLPIAITVVAVPASGTVAPGGLLRYDFTIHNLASAVKTGAVAVIDLPAYTRLAGYYTATGVLTTSPAPSTASVIRHLSGPDQLLVMIGALNAAGRPNSTRTIRLALQVQYVDPATIPGGKIMTLGYSAAFVSTVIPARPKPNPLLLDYLSPYEKLDYARLDPYGLRLAAQQQQDPSVQLASDIDFAAFLGNGSNASALAQEDSGILKTTVAGAFDQAPRLALIKAFGDDPRNALDDLQSEDQGDGTSVNVSEQGKQVTFILAAINGGPSIAQGVQLEDTVPVGLNVLASDLAASGSAGPRLLRPGFVRVLSKTPSSLGLVPRATLGTDRTIRISGLRVKPGDNVVVSYTIEVSSQGPDAPVPGTMIHQFRAAATAENLSDTDESLSVNDDLELKITGRAQVAEPQTLSAGITPFATQDVNASRLALDAIFKKNAGAFPIVAGSNPPRLVPGFYRYFVKYENLGNGAATAVQLQAPIPANTTLYRTAFLTLSSGGARAIDTRHAGNSYSLVNGVPTFAFSKINAHTEGQVLMEVIVGAGAIQFGGSQLSVPNATIQGNAVPRTTVRAAVTGRTTADAPAPQPFIASGHPFIEAAYDLLNVPRLGISKIMPQYVRVGETFTIQITAMNAGEVDAGGVLVRMSIPPHTEFVSASAGYTDAALISDGAGGHYLSVGLTGNNQPPAPGGPESMPAHQAGALTVTLRATEPGTFVENTAYIEASYTLPLYAQSATVTILSARDRNPRPGALYSLVTGLQVVNLPHTSINVVPLGGGQAVVQGRGNIIAQGGGNVVSQGGGNIISQGDSNIVVLGASSTMSVNPGSGMISSAALLQKDKLSSLLKAGACNLLLPRGDNLIGQDGGTLIGNDGGTFVPGGFSSLLANARGLIVAQGGGNIISHDGGSVISHDGGSIVAQGGGNVVSQGGGNIIVIGGASIVAQGGGNLVALPNSIGLIGQDGGTLVGVSSAGVVSQGGGN